MKKIGLGVVTYNRPQYFDKSSKAIVKTCLPYVDRMVVYNDGSERDYSKPYKWLENRKSDKIKIIHNKENHGVGYAKNQLFKELMKDCEYIFIAEDDIIPTSKLSITGYLAAHKMTGIDHLMFHAHGPGNPYPLEYKHPIMYWPSSVGAWVFYTKKILEEVGLFDEGFHNAWEHVEHTWRIFKHHKMAFGYYPDVVQSEQWLTEIPESINNSEIRKDKNWRNNMIKGLEHWQSIDDMFPTPMFELLERFKNDDKFTLA